MGQFYASIGDGSSGFVAEPNGKDAVTMRLRGGWTYVNTTVVRINGIRVDMTEDAVDTERAIEGFLVVRTRQGLKARSMGVRRRYR